MQSAMQYACRLKKNWLIPDYQMYTVYPLEGQWGLQEKYLHEPVMKKEHFFLSIDDPTA